MSFEADFTTWLRGQSSLSALIGNRLFPEGELQEKEYPFVTWRNFFGDRSISMDAPNPHTRTDIELVAYGRNLIDAIAIRDVLDTLLHGFSGTVGDSHIQGAFVSNGQTAYNSVLKTYAVELQVEIHHNK
jgi:hypothetical protein